MHDQPLRTEPFTQEHSEKGTLVDVRFSRRRRARTVRRAALTLLVLCAGLLAVRASFIRTYRMARASMAPTLCVGDRVWVNLVAYDIRLPFTGWVIHTTGNPEPGDMVVCTLSDRRHEFIKRVLAVGGDTVEFVNGRLAVNGTELPFETLDAEAFLHLAAANHLGDSFAIETIGENEHTMTFHSSGLPMALKDPITVPSGHYFLIGDNRPSSWDSRYPEFGCVPRTKILGRVIGHGTTFPAPPG